MRRKRFKKSYTNDLIRRVGAYIINSEEVTGLFYLADEKNFAMIRGDDGVIWDLLDTPTEAEKFVPEVKTEIIDIYKDICDLKAMDCLYHQVTQDRKMEWKRNGIY